MIRLDFFKGGFPIGLRIPVICIDSSYRPHVAYNRFDLATILNTIDVRNCHGVWIGKIQTDYFELDPDSYRSIPIPPEQHKYIDYADTTVAVHFEGRNFLKVVYHIPGEDYDQECKDVTLYDYLKQTGIRFRSLFEGQENTN